MLLAFICFSVVVVIAGKIPQEAPEKPLNCEGIQDGYYTVGCSQYYTQCVNSKSHPEKCPADLYYNAVYGYCDYKEAVSDCKDPMRFKGMILKTPSQFSCVNRTDGSYEHPQISCSKHYYECIQNSTTRKDCPDQQFFDQESQRCDFEHLVPICVQLKNLMDSVLKSTTKSNVITRQPLNYSTPSPIKETEITFTNDDARPICKSNGDGVFPEVHEECGPLFWKCAGGTLFKFKCQEEFVFDIDAKRCTHKNLLPKCGGVRE